MKKQSFIIGLLLLAGTVFAQEEVIPQGYPVERYEPLWKKSPFALASVTLPEAPPAGFADSLALTGILKIGDDVLVSVVDKITKERQTLSTNAEGQAIWVMKLDLSDEEPDKVAVTLRKGEESSVLRYDMNYLKQASAVLAATQPPPVAPPPTVPTQQAVNNSVAAPRVAPPPVNRPPVQRRIIIPSQPPPGENQ